MINVTAILAEIIVGVIVVVPVLWLVGRAMVGGAKAKFTDALWIVLLGIIVNAVLGAFIHGMLGLVVTLIVWIALIKHFFDASWIKAALIGIAAVVVLVIIIVVLTALGIGALGLGLSSLRFMI